MTTTGSRLTRPWTAAPVLPSHTAVSSEHDQAAAGWALTGRVSPRDVVRVAVADGAGRPQNLYPLLAPIDGPAPQLPWAVPLTDRHGQFHLIAFDLDLSHGDGNVIRDTQQLTAWLNQLHIEHSVAQSGPSGGRHVWLSLTVPAAAELVSNLAEYAAAALPTLDLSALKNAAWGSMRPPGAPHRSGGHSIILSSTNEPLSPVVTLGQLTRLTALIAAVGAAHQPRCEPQISTTPLPVDVDGHRHLPGQRRTLPPGSARALQAEPADASAAAFTILLGAVRAHWHLADIVAVIDQPGLEHIRSERRPGGRDLRSPRERQRLLARQWEKAVDAVQRTPQNAPAITDDPTFAGRAAAITGQIQTVQIRADAAPGRWSTRTGPAARRVLDALCVLALAAVSASVEADIRRLSKITGLGRETVRLRLRQLAGDGWISLTRAAGGRRGHVWIINQMPSPPGQTSYPQASQLARSQGVPPPPPLRSSWQIKLQNRLDDQAHDVFTPVGLGHAAGQLYAAMTTSAMDTEELSARLHRTAEQTTALLNDLLAVNLVVRNVHGWRRTDKDRRTSVARHLGVLGTLANRQGRYEQERTLWAWWCDELDWMRLPRNDPGKRRRGRLAVGQLTIDGSRCHGRYPRDARGRGDHRAAATLAA